jgi:hypothetical protein
VATVRKLVAFYPEQHNSQLSHSAFRGQTPDAMYFRAGDDHWYPLSPRQPGNIGLAGNRRAFPPELPAVERTGIPSFRERGLIAVNSRPANVCAAAL